MARIFVSYRREDGVAQSGRIYDRLVSTYGDSEVFMDLGKISAGVDFAQVIDEKLAACEVFIAVIGSRWLISRKGRRRLEDAADFVRREVATALQRGVRILPVLLGDTAMPGEADLPPELVGLARLNAVRIRDERFDADIDSLLLDIEEPDRPPEDTLLKRLQETRTRLRQRRNAILAGLAIIVASAAASWSDLFDVLALDTRLNSVFLSLGDLYDSGPPADSVVIAGIDAATEKALGQPFGRDWRQHHAVLVDRLRMSGVRNIAFDMYFEEPTGHDALFIEALQRAREAGIPVHVGSTTAGTDSVLPGLRPVISGAALLCVGHRLGYATTAPLWKARRESAATEVRWQSRRMGLGLAAALDPSPATVPDRTERRLLAPSGDRVYEIDIGMMNVIKSPQSACPAMRAGDESADLILRLSDVEYWRQAPRYIKYESIVAETADLAQLSGALRRKTVLVGLAGTGVASDGQPVLHRFALQTRHGVELHAEVVSNVRNPAQLHPMHWGGQLAITVVMVTLAATLRRVTAKLPLHWRVVAVIAAISLYLWVAAYFCARQMLLLNGAYHLIGFGVAYWLMGHARIAGIPLREFRTGGKT